MASFQGLDFFRHLVDTDDVVAEVGKASAGDKAHIAGADHDYPHSSSFRISRVLFELCTLKTRGSGDVSTTRCLAAFPSVAKRRCESGLFALHEACVITFSIGRLVV